MSRSCLVSLALGCAALFTSHGAKAAAPTELPRVPALENVSLAAPVPPLMLRTPVFGAVNPELEAIELELEELSAERSEYSLGGPIALIAGGGAAVLVSLYVLMLNAVNASSCDDYYSSSSCWNHDKVRNYSLMGAVAGGGMLLGGGLWLGDRVSTRRELGNEIKRLRRQRQNLLLQAPAPQPAPQPAMDEFGAGSPRLLGKSGFGGFHGVKLTLEL